ncbi:HD domain-containing protein [Orenia metallireducens]|uniref:HD domain-containing protein n=1 Tax=Orenia metallireducens TaxID=1413210 RepID=A0A285F200_9FIRM|nr:HD domain-containing protein [Orenia metallireducens]PRX34719.1 HD domain-containing protein [Orenia metallireducens]SNY05330.1 HD domain-containing protein [Orenia metallireducens]
MFKKELINRMKDYFGNDQRRIDHALQVTDYAERLIDLYQGADINSEVIIYSAILHDIGIHQAEKKYNSVAGKYQELEGPPIAKEILMDFNIDQEIIDEVCQIIGHHHSPRAIKTNNFQLLYDADWLVNLPDEYDLKNSNKPLTELIDKLYLSDVGKDLAKKLFIKSSS